VKPHAFAAAACVGLAAANFGRPSLSALVVVVLVAAAGALALSRRAATVAVCVALVAGGLGWGGARLDALDRSLLAGLVGRSEWSVVVTTAPARRTPFALRIPARVERFGAQWLDEAVLLELPPGRAPPQGSRLELVAEVERPRQSNDGFDEREWLRRKGVHVVLRGGPWRIVGRRSGIAGLADRLHNRLVETIAPGLGGERRAILRGIVLGEDEGLSPELRDAFRASGLYHLLAVSGTNVGLLVGGVLIGAWLLGVPRLAAHVGALVAIGGYVLAVGWQPSVVRAGIAGALASLAWLTARQRDRWWFLLVGALVLLAWNPYSALEAGFQLSFGAVAAIFVVVPRVHRTLEGYPLPSALRDVVAVSAACGFATAPILWLHFGAVPLYSVPANALAAPVVGPLLGLGLAAAALDPFAGGAATLVASVNGWLAAYLAVCARGVASLPFAELESSRSLALAAAPALAVAVLPRLRPPRAWRALVLAATVLVATAGWRPPAERPQPPPDGLRLTFLDVGQGDATLIEVPEGAILVDEGPPEARVADQLRDLGIRRLAALVMTHPSRDNIGGAVDVVRTLDVETLLEPDLPFENPFGRPALAEARRRGIHVVVARAGQELTVGRLRLRVLWPPDGEKRSSDANDHATVLLLSYGSFDALLPADAESNVTLLLQLPRVELYKVAHHGSADRGLAELLDRLRPQIAVVSVGKDNDYGHPAASVLHALREADGLVVLRTDRDGRVVVESDGRRQWVRAER
jgi:competence protein ComEC